MKDLVKRYGLNKGLDVYLKMRRERKGPFAPGKKYGIPLSKKKK